MTYRYPFALVGAATACSLLLSAQSASAQSIIKREGAHPHYKFEAEPHLIIRDRSGFGGSGVGPGFRGTIVVADRGFISNLNDSVGIGFGLDWLLFDDDDCDNIPGNAEGCRDRTAVILPLVMQWNFWLHREWSVFGEPGLAITINDRVDDDLDIDPFVLYGGGRYHFSDAASFTLRLGFPTSLSIGFSFFL